MENKSYNDGHHQEVIISKIYLDHPELLLCFLMISKNMSRTVTFVTFNIPHFQLSGNYTTQASQKQIKLIVISDTINFLFRYYLQHPICYMFPHVWLDLLLNILKVVVVRDIALLGGQHVAEHPRVLQQDGVNVRLPEVWH